MFFSRSTIIHRSFYNKIYVTRKNCLQISNGKYMNDISCIFLDRFILEIYDKIIQIVNKNIPQWKENSSMFYAIQNVHGFFFRKFSLAALSDPAQALFNCTVQVSSFQSSRSQIRVKYHSLLKLLPLIFKHLLPSPARSSCYQQRLYKGYYIYSINGYSFCVTKYVLRRWYSHWLHLNMLWMNWKSLFRILDTFEAVGLYM